MNLPQAELDWLKADLAAGKGPAVVFIHQQLDGEGAYYVKNAAAARTILSDSGRVRVVFQGHRHEGAFSEIDGIAYVTLKAAGEGSGPENNGYALVTVQPDGSIDLKGYHKIESRTIDRRKPDLRYVRGARTPIFKSGDEAPLSINPVNTPGFGPPSFSPRMRTAKPGVSNGFIERKRGGCPCVEPSSRFFC